MPASFPQGNFIKFIKNSLKLGLDEPTFILAGDTDDPTSVTKEAPIGSLYFREGTSEVYKKLDAGSSTNWQLVGNLTGPASSTDDALAKFDGTTGKVIQNSVGVLTDAGALSGLTQLDVDNLRLDGNTLSSTDTNGNINLTPDGSGEVLLKADGVAALSAATKQQVDAAIDGIQRKASVVAATTGNITLSGTQTIDGIALVATDRCLVKDQTDQTENGIYDVAAGAWSRSSDANTSAELNHAITSVQSGTANANTAWEQTTDNPNIGSDNIVWAQAYGAGTFTADEVTLTLTGSVFSILAGGVSNTQVNASAAIALSKLAALTASRALVSDGSGVVSVSAVTSTELGFVSGVTSSIQTQIDGKQDDVITTRGDLVVGNASNEESRLAVGAANTVLSSDGTDPSWGLLVDANIDGAAAITLSKLAALTTSRALVSDGSGVVSVSAVTSTELGFVSGVTSAIQTQLDGKVDGPASATDEAIARYDATTGKLVQNSLVTIDDTGVMSGATQLNVDNLRLDGNTLSSTDTNGNVILDPDGSGTVDVNTSRITSVTDPTGDQDAATKNYVDDSHYSVNSISINTNAVARETYLVDTTSTVQVTLPTPTADVFVRVKDSTGNATAQNITVARNGAENIDGQAANYIIDSAFGAAVFVSDGTDWFVF